MRPVFVFPKFFPSAAALLLAAALAAGCARAPWAPPPLPPNVSYHSLLNELTDLNALPDFPDPPFKLLRASSYDRRSTDPKVATDAGWFANNDSGAYLNHEVEAAKGGNAARDEYVLMESNAPGAVMRIWADKPAAAGTIRFYFDGAPKAALTMPLEKLLEGKTAPFFAPLAGIHAGGWNCWLPIPYAQSCKITTDKPDLAYQIDYREYALNAHIPTWSDGLIAEQADALGPLLTRLGRPNTLSPIDGGRPNSQRYDMHLDPGAMREQSVWGVNEAIYRLTCRIEAPSLPRALRGVTIEIFFDGHDNPDVVAPLGDFFGAAPGSEPFRTLATGLLDDGTMYCHWVMPYAYRARLRFVNRTTTPVFVTGEIATDRRARNDRTQYFHAKWRAAYNEPARPLRDWTLLRAVGRGRLVGMGFAVASPSSQWWGDGDDKIYVDAMGFPALFGTGTADAFGFGETAAAPLSHAYHAVGLNSKRAPAGLTAMTRIMLGDSVPFASEMKLDFEIWRRDAEARADWAGIAYWYADATAQDTFSMPSADQLRLPSLGE